MNSESEGNWFSTLVPVLFDDRAKAEPSDFPNNGLVWWMVKPSVVVPSRDNLAEIVTIPTSAISKPRDLVRERSFVTLDHPPTDLVLVRWRGRLYGPLRASSEPGRSVHMPFG